MADDGTREPNLRGSHHYPVAAGTALIPDLPAHKGLRLDLGGVVIAGA